MPLPLFSPLLEPVLREAMKLHRVPGLAVAVTHRSHVVYQQGFGVMDAASETHVTPASLFHVASVTKTFVAAAVMQLVEAAEISLDGPVTAYLPYFAPADPRGGSITVRQLLGHTSGLPDVTDYGWATPVHDDDALERFVRSLAGEGLVCGPGEAFRYSNIGYSVLGDLIAKVSGQSFESYLLKEVLAPLGMTASTLNVHDAAPGTVASPHVAEGGELRQSPVFPYNRIHAPSSTLLSSAAEMARWAIASVHRGELFGTRILEAASYDRMWRSAVETGRKDGSKMGLGWFIREHRGLTLVGHGGQDLGFRAAFYLAPEASLGAVVLSNGDTTPVFDLCMACLDAALGLTPEPAPAPSAAPEGAS